LRATDDVRRASANEQLTITKLIEQFQYDSYEKRDSATKELVRIGMIAEPQLREAMNHKDAEVRVRARRIREKVLSPEPVAKLSGHRGDVEVVCFTPDSHLIASASRGGDIKIWNTSTFREVLTLDANH
jgi:WD40 repeat protein